MSRGRPEVVVGQVTKGNHRCFLLHMVLYDKRLRSRIRDHCLQDASSFGGTRKTNEHVESSPALPSDSAQKCALVRSLKWSHRRKELVGAPDNNPMREKVAKYRREQVSKAR